VGAVVEMYRDAAEPSGRDRFSCPVGIWELLHEIGRTFGWLPTGATYVAPGQLTVEVPARRDYLPGGALDQKRIEQDDAIAWARALDLAKDSPHLASMVTARAGAISALDGQVTETLLPGVIEEFVEFAYGGAFTFVLSSSPDAS
jgi:hypothetical protein